MKRSTFSRISEDQQVSQVENPLSDGDLYDDAVGKAAADYYDRSWKNRINIQQLDIWIAVGLYLVLSGIAFVVLY